MSETMAIAGSAWHKILGMKVIYFLVLCALILVASTINYAELSLGCERQLMIDVSLVLNTLAAILTAVSVAFEIPRELRTGEAVTILSKPLGRTQYLLGKLIGVSFAGIVITGLIAIGFMAIYSFAFDKATVPMLQGHLLIMASVIPMTAMAVFFSTFIPDPLAAVVSAGAIWFSFSAKALVAIPFLYGGIIPDLNLFNLKAEAAYDLPIQWAYIGTTIVWGIVYAIFATSLGSLLFSQRDIK